MAAVDENLGLSVEKRRFMPEPCRRCAARNSLMEKIRKLLDKVDVLPLSPTLLPKLLPKLSDVDTNFDEVVEIIAFDPGADGQAAANLQQRLFRP